MEKRTQREARWLKKGREYLQNTVSFTGHFDFYRQPLWMPALRSAVTAGLLLAVFSTYKNIGLMLSIVFAFFKLETIFKLDFPGIPFFEKLSLLVLILFFGFHAIGFFLRQIEAMRSLLAFSKGDKNLYYIRNRLFSRNLYVFPINEISHFTYRENLLDRAAKTGTIELTTEEGTTVTIPSLKNAPDLVMKVNGIIKR